MELHLPYSGTSEDKQSIKWVCGKLHTLAFTGVKIRDAAVIYSRVDVNKQQVEHLKILGQQ